MKRLEQLVTLVNLLNSRGGLTLRAIKDHCRVTERTAYRYLRALSEANIPVYFDKARKAYRIDPRDSSLLPDITLSDTILIIVALGILSEQVNEHYQRLLQDLLNRFEGKMTVPIEELIQAYDFISPSGHSPQTTSDKLTAMMVNASILFKRRLNLDIGKNSGKTRRVLFSDPGLSFDSNWLVRDANKLGGQKQAVPLNSILCASLL